MHNNGAGWQSIKSTRISSRGIAAVRGTGDPDGLPTKRKSAHIRSEVTYNCSISCFGPQRSGQSRNDLSSFSSWARPSSVRGTINNKNINRNRRYVNDYAPTSSRHVAPSFRAPWLINVVANVPRRLLLISPGNRVLIQYKLAVVHSCVSMLNENLSDHFQSSHNSAWKSRLCVEYQSWGSKQCHVFID